MKKNNMSTMESTSSSISTKEIQLLVDKLKTERNRNSTRKTYYGIWKSFNEFFIKLDEKPVAWEDRLVLYVGHLVSLNRKANTINSYISAIKSVLLDDGIVLNEDKYLLSSLTHACRYRNNSTVRTRLPISKPVLAVLLEQTDNYFLDKGQEYLAILYKALFASAYYGLLRVGEITKGSHPVLAPDVHIGKNKKINSLHSENIQNSLDRFKTTDNKNI